MEHDQEMTEVFEEEPQAMEISDGTPMEQRGRIIIINILKKQFYKLVLATMSDEIAKNISATSHLSGRGTVSVYYRQSDGRYLLCDKGKPDRTIWLCDGTKTTWSDGTSYWHDGANNDGKSHQ